MAASSTVKRREAWKEEALDDLPSKDEREREPSAISHLNNRTVSKETL